MIDLERVSRATHAVGAALGVKLPRGVPADLADALGAARVFVSVRGDSIRVAPHLYDDADDVRWFVDVLRAAIRGAD